MKIYTKTGDAGQTGLWGGGRVDKDAPRIEAYGAVDELNSVLGMVRAAGVPGPIDALVVQIQNELFCLGAELATPDPSKQPTGLLTAAHIEALEKAIDRLEAQLPPLNEFILPGGTKAAAGLHLARTICRRAERRLVTLSRKSTEPIRGETVVYLNRLSDLLFVLAREVNRAAGCAEAPWEKPA